MHRQFKQRETELLRDNAESIKCLEMKYKEMLNDETEIFNADKWLQVWILRIFETL